MAQTKIPLSRIEEGEKIAKLISRYDSFEARFDRLWKSIHKQFKKRGVTTKDIDRAIREVRASYR